jgi:uncharacterized protein (DUF1697 family)
MSRYVGFLRAINVAGHGRIKMTDVRDAFTAAGAAGVETYIQSGNVVFECAARYRATVARRAAHGLSDALGETPELMIRPMSRLVELVNDAPFVKMETRPETKLYVVFLARKPQHRIALPLVSDKEALEIIEISEREVFLISRRKRSGFFGFPNNFVEENLNISATSRNWSTVTKIVARFATSPARPQTPHD